MVSCGKKKTRREKTDKFGRRLVVLIIKGDESRILGDGEGDANSSNGEETRKSDGRHESR
jgi:hypothetical protein